MGQRAVRESDTPKICRLKRAGLQNPGMQLGDVDFRPWTALGTKLNDVRQQRVSMRVKHTSCKGLWPEGTLS